MTTTPFYREQAAREQSAADAAALENVRVRSQRAADAWSQLAERSERKDVGRDPAPTATA